MKRRALTPEEMLLWDSVTQHDRKVENRKVPAPPPLWNEPIHVAQRASMPQVGHGRMAPELSLGAYAGVDRNTAERFRKGELTLDGKVDLHGMSRERAHKEITDFLHRHYMRGSRFVLAITGKGLKQSSADEERGILREMLPHWLAEPGLRPLVLAFDVARPQHGGSGAYYILLRRKR